MKVKVPTHHNVNYVLAKRRTVESLLMPSVAEVEIPEVHDADAPVVHIAGEAQREPTASAYGPIHRRTPFALVDGQAPEIRSFDGSYFVQRCSVLNLLSSLGAPGPTNLFSGFYEEGGFPVVAGLTEERPSGGRERVYRSREEFEESIGSKARVWDPQFPKTQAALDRRAGDLAIIGSHVYERVGEPVLTVYLPTSETGTFTLGLSEATRIPGFSKGQENNHPGVCVRFGLDEIAKARETGLRLARSSNGKFVDRTQVERVAIDAVRFRGEPEFFAHSCRVFVEAAAPVVQYMESSYARAWHDLSNAVYERPGPSWKAIEAARAICEMERISAEGGAAFRGNSGYGTSDAGNVDHAAAWLREAMAMWDDRTGPETGIEWTGHASGLMATATYDGASRAWEIQSLMDADEVARQVGCAVPGSSGRPREGWAVAVEDREEGVKSAFLVEEGPDGPEIAASVARHGGTPSDRHAKLAVVHVTRSLASRPSDAPDVALFGF